MISGVQKWSNGPSWGPPRHAVKIAKSTQVEGPKYLKWTSNETNLWPVFLSCFVWLILGLPKDRSKGFVKFFWGFCRFACFGHFLFLFFFGTKVPATSVLVPRLLAFCKKLGFLSGNPNSHKGATITTKKQPLDVNKQRTNMVLPEEHCGLRVFFASICFL